MSLALPTSLSPSKVASFKECALAFRYSALDHLPEPPSPHAAKGTVVHKALELLMWEEAPGHRSLDVALEKLRRAQELVLGGEEYSGLNLDEGAEAEFLADSEKLVRNYYRLEDPNRVRVIGTELMMSVQVGSFTLRGIIDRLELDDEGGLVVTDYKTGWAPREAYEQSRLGGVQFYAFLCEQLFGRRPSRVQLLHLRDPLVISATPTEQSLRGLRQQTSAIWEAIERACQHEDFRPRPGWLCGLCAFQPYCPAMGGDPALAAAEVATRAARHTLAAVASEHGDGIDMDVVAPSDADLPDVIARSDADLPDGDLASDGLASDGLASDAGTRAAEPAFAAAGM